MAKSIRTEIREVNIEISQEASAGTSAATLTSGTLDGDRLPGFSTTKRAGVPATGAPSGKFLKDDETWATPAGGGGGGSGTFMIDDGTSSVGGTFTFDDGVA